MRVVELKNNDLIENLIPEALRKCHGEAQEAAKLLGQSKSTFSRWVMELGLQETVNRIRSEYGWVAPRSREAESSLGRNGVNLSAAVAGDCTFCHTSLDDLDAPVLEKITQRTKKVGEFFLVILDRSRKRHWYKIDPEAMVAEKRRRREGDEER
jgi:hypothetical protein